MQYILLTLMVEAVRTTVRRNPPYLKGVNHFEAKY